MRYIYLIWLLLILSNLEGFAQRVKYKELFILLNAENYEDADPYLRMYLEKDPEHSNANFHMGKMLHSYMQQENLLNSYDRINELADSSILYYKRALQYLTERDVKRHDDDFYAEFRRRDMRSGKFGVNFHDVEAEYQNRIEEVEKYKDGVDRMNHFKSKTISFYDSCQSIYLEFTYMAETPNMFYFTAGANELDQLRLLKTLYDSAVFNLNTYRSIMKSISDNKQGQDFVTKPIIDYPVEGKSITNLYMDKVEFWNYKEWVNKVLDIIGKQVFPLKKRMLAYDEKLAFLYNEVINDSIDGRSEVFKLATQSVGRDLRNYENNSLPAALYNYRIADINFHSILNVWHKQVKDTFDIGYKLDFLNDVDKQLSSLSRLLQSLEDANTDYMKRVFRDFIIERWTSKGVDYFLDGEVEHVNRDKYIIEEWLSAVNDQDKITVWKEDSIALVPGMQTNNRDSTRYSTISVDSLSAREIGFYSWLQVEESFYLAYGVAPSSRKLDTLYTVNLTDSINHQLLLANQFISDSVGLGQKIWLINTIEPLDSGIMTLVFKTDLSAGFVWKSCVVLPKVPRSTVPDFDSSTVAILNDEDEIMVVLNSRGEVKEELPPPEID